MPIRNGNEHMKNNTRIKLSFKGVIIEMLTDKKIAKRLVNAFYIGVWLFGIATLLHAVAPTGLIH